MAYQKPMKITLKNTRFIYETNFAGNVDKFGNSDRYFNVIVDPTNPQNKYGKPSEMQPLKLEDLVNDGWNVHFTKETEEYPSQAFIKVRAAFRKRDGSPVKRPPHVIKAIGGPDYKLKLDEKDCQFIEDYIASIDRWDVDVDRELWQIVMDEVMAYLRGGQDIDKTIDMIQNRASLWVCERY